MKARRLQTPIAILLLAVQLAGLTHLVLARHETCAEHGAIVEAPAGEAQAAAEGTTPSVWSTTATVESADDHCAFFATERRSLAVTVVHVANPDLHSSAPARRPTPLLAVGPRPLYRLAPKTSPPV
jgi:hypothetical protein